jgi:hypothetical protein
MGVPVYFTRQANPKGLCPFRTTKAEVKMAFLDATHGEEQAKERPGVGGDQESARLIKRVLRHGLEVSPSEGPVPTQVTSMEKGIHRIRGRLNHDAIAILNV